MDPLMYVLEERYTTILVAFFDATVPHDENGRQKREGRLFFCILCSQIFPLKRQCSQRRVEASVRATAKRSANREAQKHGEEPSVRSASGRGTSSEGRHQGGATAGRGTAARGASVEG